MQPKLIDIKRLISMSSSLFVDHELFLSDSFSDYLIKALELDQAAVVIELEEDNPVSFLKENTVGLRFNGRLLPPNIEGIDWIQLAEEWFDKIEIEGKAAMEGDILKFTVMVSSIIIPVEEKEKEIEKEKQEKAIEENKTEEFVPEESGAEDDQEPTDEELDKMLEEIM